MVKKCWSIPQNTRYFTSNRHWAANSTDKSSLSCFMRRMSSMVFSCTNLQFFQHTYLPSKVVWSSISGRNIHISFQSLKASSITKEQSGPILVDRQSLANSTSILFKMNKNIETTLPTKTIWPAKWTNGEEWKSWEKLSINIATCWKAVIKMRILTSIPIRLCLSCPIRKKLCSERSFSQLLRSTLPKDLMIHHSKESSTWSLNV